MIRHIHILLILSMLLLTSCGRDLSKAFDKLKIQCSSSEDPKKQVIPAAKCREWYPVPEKVTEEVIKYLPGKPIEIPGDTIYQPTIIDCDEVVKKGGGKQLIKVPVPVYIRVDTSQIIRSVKVKDMQEIEYWRLTCEAEKKNKEKAVADLQKEKIARVGAEKSLSTYRFRFFGLIGLLVLVLAAYLLKKRFF